MTELLVPVSYIKQHLRDQ